MSDALQNLALFQQNIDAAAPGSGIQATVEQLVSSIPADDRTINFLSDTGLVDDEIRRLRSTVVEIETRFVPTNDPTGGGGGGGDDNRSGPLNKSGPTTVNVDMKMDFNGVATQRDVAAGVRDGMNTWARDLQREGVI